MSRYKETTGYLIHQRNYKDNSLIIEFFSQDYGRINLIAKGIKKNKLIKSQLQYFSLLKIQYFGKSQLKTIAAINILNIIKPKNLIAKTAGLYLNELLHYSLIENDSANELFDCYQYVLSHLGKQKLAPLLRCFEKTVLKHNGFELNVSSLKQENDWLTITEHQGLITTTKDTEKLCQVGDLKKFISMKKQDEQLDRHTQKRINKFMLQAINMNFAYRKIYARELLQDIT
ncbi:hypothetical protein MNBD_GAMMA01-459 [hydrothermal vent metagenome]|uniref:DNA repair protein RecO n=1 Tax=hydrothermal vent metagenome TaxID=652676 RepID=A0A3B0UNX7_9ZZZZ